MSNEAITNLGLEQSLRLCFKITLANNEVKYLTNQSEAIKLNDKVYLPHSGLNFIDAAFNQSGGYVKLAAIYEDSGITQKDILQDCCVEIFIVTKENAADLFVKYYCTKTYSNLLSCVLYLEPISVKLNKSIVEFYSPTCRAGFGDDRCKIDPSLYSDEVEVINITQNIVTFKDNNKASGYYTYGTLAIEFLQYKARIIKHQLNIVELDVNIPLGSLEQISIVKLIAGCDKVFNTCCHKFNNAVNFRGEPFIPKSINSYNKFNV
jgi:uncharacterized phage protein (TIGR02218 family)